jgi:hypothetical protein
VQIAVISTAILLLASWAAAKELIEPSRTLDRPENQAGHITVYSEPPEMPVVVDGNKVGVTPLINFDIEPGTHVLTIDNNKIEIYVNAEKPIRLAYFKGKFIELRDKPTESSPPPFPESDPRKAPVQKETQLPDMPPSPYYWPINPKGPIF